MKRAASKRDMISAVKAKDIHEPAIGFDVEISRSKNRISMSVTSRPDNVVLIRVFFIA